MGNILTREEYVAKGGLICPVCNSSAIEAVGQIEADGPGAWQHAKCSSCGANWTDEYSLTGFVMNVS